eukprot:COSAG04_NODE_10264_length_791_cov_1.115607_2_plen_94_part_00
MLLFRARCACISSSATPLVSGTCVTTHTICTHCRQRRLSTEASRQAPRKDEQVLTVMKQKKAKICAGEKSSTASGKTSVSIAAQSQCVPEPSD